MPIDRSVGRSVVVCLMLVMVEGRRLGIFWVSFSLADGVGCNRLGAANGMF
jgi:hypothetical protein